jgi:hypothetical protein
VNRIATLGCALLVALASPGVARAEESHPTVELRLDPSVEGCVGNLDTVRRAVVIDLGAELVAEHQVDATQVDVTCTGDEATIRVDDPLTRKLVERRVGLGQQPRAGRARLLGLAIAETVAASWVELEMVGSEEPRADVVAAPPQHLRSGAAAVAQARLRVHRSPATSMPTLGLAATVRGFTGDDLVTAGARVDGAWPVGARLAIHLDLTGEWGRASAAAGDVDAWSLSIAPRVAARVSWAAFELSASVGFRLGLVDLRGKSRNLDVVARSFMAPWGGPLCALEARTSLARHLAVALGLEAGRVTLEVQGQVESARAAGISGWWAGAWLSFVYLP